ncbi:Flp pilus assembly protein CpaB [Schinkia sp. CFF1]
MNTKKIWIMAIIFGIIMASIFYIVTAQKAKTIPNNTVVEQPPSEESTEVGTDTKVANGLQIGAGKRAISIAVDEVQSVSGFVRPGSFVDIVATFPAQTNMAKSPQMIIENVRVLAVGKTTVDQEGKEPEAYQTITVEVSPQDGATIAFAKQGGTITLMLRGNE